MTYPSSYHAAMTALVHCGPASIQRVARPLIARALRTIKAGYGHAAAKSARRDFAICNSHFIR